MNLIRLNPRQSLYFDRIAEYSEFYNIGVLEFVKILLKYGVPDGARYKRNMFKIFKGNTGPENLKKLYEKIAKYWALRQLVNFQREKDIKSFIETVKIYEKVLNRKIDVIDYGCGVSDLGLVMAYLGHYITICDLQDSKLDFAAWRYGKRNLNVDVLPILDTEKLPDLQENKYDIVIASDIMKQIRNPLALLELFYQILRPNGLFYCTQGTLENGWGGSKIGGDRLKEAVEMGNSGAYKKFFMKHFIKYEDNKYWWIPIKI